MQGSAISHPYANPCCETNACEFECRFADNKICNIIEGIKKILIISRVAAEAGVATIYASRILLHLLQYIYLLNYSLLD
jgi:hypothetical protein